jgi:uncharacterized protein YndB with AHSA1/START domain
MAAPTASTTNPTPTLRVQVRRVIDAPPERVFQAWTTPEDLKRWHAPAPTTCVLAEVDLRVGGAYRIHMREPNGVEHRHHGTYRVIEPPRRLIYSWNQYGDDVADTIVTIECIQQGTGTELVLTHEGFLSEDRRASHEQGWTAIFNQIGAEL